MTMTGNGAMNQEDITYLRMGYFCFLPNDHDGRTVICYDPSRRLDHSKLTRMRIGFYFWSLICENEISVRNGYVGIVLLGNGSFGASSLDGAIKECVDLVMDCFPTKTKNIHLVQTIRPAGTRRSLLQMLLPYIFSVMGRILENNGVQHVSDSGVEMVKEFSSFGLDPSGLPESAGGSWTYDDFYQWQLERCRLERKKYEWNRYPSVSAFETNVEAAPHAMLREPSASIASLPGLALMNTLSTAFSSSDQDFIQLDYNIRRLPNHEKAAYLEAMERAPALVRTESNPAWFSRFAAGDFRAASRQLASYWILRRQLFDDRAFLPMAQTGEGALGRKELTLLSSSFFTVLPTKQNEPVIVSYDCAKDDTLDEHVRLRVAFYILSLVMERDTSRTGGFHIVASGMKELASSHGEGTLTNSAPFDSILTVMPIRVAAIHIIMLLQPDMALYPLDKTVQLMRGLFGSAGSSKGLVHVGTSRDEIIEHLLPYNIGKDLLPKSLGGGFGYDRFTQWQELRIRYEWGLPAGANDPDAMEIYDFSKVVPFSDLPEDDRKERKRRMNVVHSRRKRERERIEIECLQEQCEELRDRQAFLLEESSRLENLLRRAENLKNAQM